MRIRRSTRELIYTAEEFARLDAAAICRRMSLGDAWVDRIADARAERAMNADA